MKRLIVVMIMALALALSFAPAPAVAGIEVIQETLTIPITDTGSTAGMTIQMDRSNIRDVYLWVPTLDASDTATVTMTYQPFSTASNATSASTTVVPNGWSNLVIGATDDNGILSVFSSLSSIYVDGPITLTVTCSTQQSAQRVFLVAILREY